MAQKAKVKKAAAKRIKNGKFRRVNRAHGNTKVSGKLVLGRRKNSSIPASEESRVARMLGEE